MEIIQTIWTALSSENEELINIFVLPLTCIEMIVSMLLFTYFFNIKISLKQKKLYIVFTSIFTVFSEFCVKEPYQVLINVLFYTLLIHFLFRVHTIKSLIVQLLPYLLFVALESFLVRFIYILFGVSFNQLTVVPVYRILFIFAMYIFAFIIYLLIKHFRINISIFEAINFKGRLLLWFNFLFVFLTISVQLYITKFYSISLPLLITFFSISSLIIYFIISLYSLWKAIKLQKTEVELKEELLYNKSLSYLYDNIRAFKHNYTNMLDTIGGYIEENDIEHLKIYYSELASECNRVTNLAVLDPKKINNPGLYNLLTSKYLRAFNLKVNMDFNILADINSFDIKIYDFAKILGIFLDNAIEAAKECNEKIIHVILKKEANSNKQIIIIENTYSDKNINLDKIYEKGFSTKFNNTGLGLWEVNKIVKKYNNINLITAKTETYFRQTLEFYIF